MKKNKILYLIFTLIIMFSFTTKVDAAKELTCLYKKAGTNLFKAGTEKVLLIQYSNGERIIALNVDDKSLDESGWYISDKDPGYIDNTVPKNNDKDLDPEECPKYSSTTEEGRIFFSHDDHRQDTINFFGHTFSLNIFGYTFTINPDNYMELEIDLVDEIKEPAFSSTVPPTGSTGWLTTLDTNRYTGSCKYKRTLDDGSIHYVQIDFGKKDMLATEYDEAKYDTNADTNYSGQREYEGEEQANKKYVGSFKFNKDITVNEFTSGTNGDCLPIIVVSRKVSTTNTSPGIDNPNQQVVEIVANHAIKTQVNVDGAKGDNYSLEAVRGKNPITGENLTLNGKVPITFIPWGDIENCEQLLGEDLAGKLKVVWNLVKIGVPILLIGLGILDFGQAIFAGNEDNMKKAQTKFIKRVIIAVVIFLVPTILGVILDIANNIWGNFGTDICGILG